MYLAFLNSVATGKKYFGQHSYDMIGGNYATLLQSCDPIPRSTGIDGLFQGEYQILETIENKG